MIFSIYYLGTTALALFDWRGRLARWRFRAPALPAWIWCAILAVTYAAQLAILYAAAQHQWPVPLVGAVPKQADATSLSILLLAVLQTIALVGLYRAKPHRIEILAAMAVSILLSLAAPVFANADAYAYVGNGLLGLHAYTPPDVPFAGDLAEINARWGTPVPAATYGPLWLVIAKGFAAAAPTLIGKLFAFRVLGALAFLAIVGLLREAGMPSRVVALVAVNPAFAWQFVLDAHNDALALAVVLAAASLARRLPVLACGFLVVAALIKLPYALVGLPILFTIQPRGWRYFLAAAVVAASLAVSWLIGGYSYLESLLVYARSSRLESYFHIVAEAGAVVLLLGALAGMRRLRSGVWLIAMLGAYTAPWYLAWSVPYAVSRRRVLAYLAIWLPVVSAIAEPCLTRPWTLFFLIPALIFTAIL